MLWSDRKRTIEPSSSKENAFFHTTLKAATEGKEEERGTRRKLGSRFHEAKRCGHRGGAIHLPGSGYSQLKYGPTIFIARAAGETGGFTWCSMLEYKCTWYGRELVVVDR